MFIASNHRLIQYINKLCGPRFGWLLCACVIIMDKQFVYITSCWYYEQKDFICPSLEGRRQKVIVFGGAHHKFEDHPTPGSCGQTTTFCWRNFLAWGKIIDQLKKSNFPSKVIEYFYSFDSFDNYPSKFIEYFYRKPALTAYLWEQDRDRTIDKKKYTRLEKSFRPLLS